MKPAAFDYVAADSVDGALAALAETGTDAKVIAGGQSLVPMMNFRLARPGRLVDVNRVPGLAYIRKQGGALRVGAVTRQATVERSTTIARHWPLLHGAIRYVAHPQIRNRGTIGGSIAHADPGAEICTVLLAYDGYVEVCSVRGSRTIAARELFLGQFVTALQPDELITAVVLPPTDPRTGSAFHEVARRHGDFALAGAATVVSVDEDGTCSKAAVALLGVDVTPVRAELAEQVMVGAAPHPRVITEAAAAALKGITPPSDVHGSAAYRLRALEEMVRRSLTEAWLTARGAAA